MNSLWLYRMKVLAIITGTTAVVSGLAAAIVLLLLCSCSALQDCPDTALLNCLFCRDADRLTVPVVDVSATGDTYRYNISPRQAAGIDTVWRPLPKNSVLDNEPVYAGWKPYTITVVGRYNDIQAYSREVLVRWHYRMPDGRYNVIPVDGYSFTCDNVITK
jgi:hypothetical protein